MATIWEWNGTDTSQFDAVQVISDAGDAGTLGGTISTDTSTASPQVNGTRLALATTGLIVSGQHMVIFPITQALPQSYEVQINSDLMSDAVGTNIGWGIFFWGDLSGNGHGYAWHCQSWVARLDNGTLTTNNVTNPSMTDQGDISIRIEGRPAPFVDYPHGQMLAQHVPLINSRYTQLLRNAYSANDGDWGFGTLPPASWAGTAGDRFAFGIRTNATTSPDWFINSARITTL